MSARTILARLPGALDEIVISRDRAGQIDLRLWTDLNGLGIRMASKLALPPERLPQVIEALKVALDSTETRT
ncbi:MAG: hypothetical protein ACREDO_01590 [Methyloceanibacter sp.]